jgi:hypothetical protein
VADGSYRAPVTVRWSCADATSGVATCPPDSVLTSIGPGQSVSATATDIAGNAGTGTVGGIDIRPAIEPGFHITVDPIPGGLLARDGRLTGKVTDSFAAITGVKVVYTPEGGFSPGGGNADNPKTVQATLTCDAGRQVCSWTTPAPPRGDWSARATATDADSRSATSDRVTFSVR